jgi:hypothetical protein
MKLSNWCQNCKYKRRENISTNVSLYLVYIDKGSRVTAETTAQSLTTKSIVVTHTSTSCSWTSTMSHDKVTVIS